MVIAVIILAAAAALCFLTAPRIRPRCGKITGRFAHRGCHTGGIKENTLPAFEKAVAEGVGFELDVRLSSDGVPVISHDANLKRVFDTEKNVSETSLAELEGLGVPSFESVLKINGGKVPMIVEVKGEDFDCSVCEKTMELLGKYEGEYFVESFNPFYLRYIKRKYPSVVRGQLAMKFSGAARYLMLSCLLCNVISRPDFIAYDHKDADMPAVRFCRLLGAKTVCWSPEGEDAEKCLEKYGSVIYEEN